MSEDNGKRSPQDIRKIRTSRQETREKYFAYSLLRQQGYTQDQAGKLLGYAPRTAATIEKTIRERKQDLTILSETRIKRAHQVVDRLMRGKTWGEISTIRSSDALRAAEAVLDRAEPKHQEQAAPSYSFTQINLNMARPDSPEPIDDVENPRNRDLPVQRTLVIEPETVGS